VTITGPSGTLPYTRGDFAVFGFGSFVSLYMTVPGEPAKGNYTFILGKGGVPLTTQDSQSTNIDIPNPDISTLSEQGGSFSWEAVSLPGVNLYYRLVIDDLSGKRVYNSNRELGMLSHTIPDNKLVQGQTYKWHVRVSDAADWISEQNRSNSEYVQFTYRGLGNVLARQRVWGDGLVENQMQFQLKDASNQNLTRSVSLADIKVYNPNGEPVHLTEITFYDVAIGTYNDQTDQWNYPSPSFETYGYALFSDPLIVGRYTTEVTHNGETYAGTSYFNGQVGLPKVDPTSFVLTGDSSGNLTWEWTLPEGLCTESSVYTPPMIALYRQGQLLGLFFFRVPNGQCIHSFPLPASFVQSINAAADRVELLVDIRTNTQNNASLSLPLTLTRLGPPALAEIRGRVTDDDTGGPVQGATVSLEPGTITLTSQTDGTFLSSEITAGHYSAQISAVNYNIKVLSGIALAPGLPNQLNVSLTPYAPQVISATATPPRVGNDGQSTTLLTVRITHPLGPSSVDSVLGDLAPIGGSTQQVFYDDSTHGDLAAGDGTYSYGVTVAKGTGARLYALNVTAVDMAGKQGFGSISLSVTDKLSGTVQPSQSVSQNFDNALDGQTLNVHFDFSKTVSSLKAIKADCQIQLTIIGPDGSQYGPYYGTDSIDVSIPNAAAGEWEYVTTNQCASTLSYEVETSGSGTGMLVGRVVDALTGVGVNGANINCNTGGSTVSLTQGYYSGVAVAGTGVVTTAKAGYRTNVKSGVHVKSGSTTNLNIQVVPQNASVQTAPSGANVFNILDPAEDPKPPAQPFAVKISGTNLEFNVIFPRYQQAVDLYLAFMPNTGEHAGKLFLIDETNSFVEFAGALHAWRKTTSQEESAQIPIPSEYPLGVYTLYSLVTTDSSSLSNFDLSFFATTPTQPPPVGQDMTLIPNPSEEPDPLTQPLTAKVTDGNLVLKAHFPMQKEPVSIFLAYMTPEGAIRLIKSDNTTELLSGTLWPWREDVTSRQTVQVLTMPTAQMAPGVYYFYSLVTTDPAALSNFDLFCFSMNVTQ
jgi:hypothetical protein